MHPVVEEDWSAPRVEDGDGPSSRVVAAEPLLLDDRVRTPAAFIFSPSSVTRIQNFITD